MDDNVVNEQAKNLTKAIFQHESGMDYNATGDAGTSKGAGQWQPGTWKAQAKDVLGDENAPMTPENQSVVAQGTIRGLIKKGKNAAQIAAIWNSGSDQGWENKVGTTTINGQQIKYNVPKYVKDVTDLYQQLKTGQQNQQNIPQNQETNSSENNNEITGNETPGQAGMNALKNTIPSAINFGIGAAKTFNPLNTKDTLSKIPGEFNSLAEESGGVLPAIGNTIKEIPGALYKGLVPQALRQLISGDTQGASKSIQEDPFGTVAPLVLGAEEGAKFADKTATKSAMAEYAKEPFTQQTIPKPVTKYSDAFSTGVEKTASLVTKPISAVMGKIGDATGGITRSLASQLTSLDPQTMQQILQNPSEFSKVAQDTASRGGLAGEVNTAINDRIKGLAETGKSYEPIRQQTEMIPEHTGFIDDILEKNGLRIEKGKIKSDSMSTTRNTADITALQKFYDNWGKRIGLTPSEFLNMRGDLADLAKYDKLTGTGKTPKSQIIADQLRQQSNKVFRPHIKGLEKLDTQYANETTFLKKVKKDYINPDGTFKDGAVNKIANATGLGKENLLGRLEKVVPGITKRIKILKAVEDIQRANGIKVGSYTRSAMQAGGILTGNMPAIITSILTSPSSAVRILRTAGYTGAKIAPILDVLKKIGGDVNKFPQKSGLLPGLLARQQQNTY